MSEEIKELIDTLEDCLKNPNLFDRAKAQRFYNGVNNLQQKVERLEKENKELRDENKRIFQNVNDDELLISNAMNYTEVQRLNNIINELEKYIHNELVLDFYNDDMPCELIINKMEKMIKELKENK